MTACAGATLSSDNNGNLTYDGTSTYTWDARNDLIAQRSLLPSLLSD
jgi:hypothetical protein